MRLRIIAWFKGSGCLCAFTMGLLLLFAAPTETVVGAPGDDFLAGYAASILESDLHWTRDSYRLTVAGSMATVTLFAEDAPRRESAEKALRAVEGLQEVAFVVAPTECGKPKEGEKT